MKKVRIISVLLIVLSAIFFYCCSTLSSKRGEVEVLKKDSTKNNFTQQKSGNIATDSIIEKKLTEAFWSIKKYSKESKVLHKNFSKQFLDPFSSLSFGTYEVKNDWFVFTNNGKEIPLAELVIFIETENNPGYIAKAVNVSKGITGIVFSKEFVKENSVAIIASVLLHEMVHMGLYVNKPEQGLENISSEDELIAYSTQFSFLMYFYGGVENELRYSRLETVTLVVPYSDTLLVNFYNKQIEKFRPSRK